MLRVSSPYYHAIQKMHPLLETEGFVMGSEGDAIMVLFGCCALTAVPVKPQHIGDR
jgi:hypothetical protein